MSAKASKKQSALQKRAKGAGLDASTVLRCTEKAANAALLIWQRCQVCHGCTVRDVLGAMLGDGASYTMADLRYDLKLGRLEALAAGADAGALPKPKPRPDAPLAGQPLPEASLDEFLLFLQCQMRMELREHTGEHLALEDPQAEKMWPDVEAFVTPNLGATERWVPYHTILGVHEIFLVQHVHDRKEWNERQRFQAMFIFRSHCKRDLFLEAQLPLMLAKKFWDNPSKAFQPGGAMEEAILKYRKKTGKPLITSCFRIIPPRVLKDDDRNLVRSITDRTMRLLEVADHAWAVLKDSSKSAAQKMEAMSERIREASGLGDTWAKMLTVCIDLAYPKAGLLESQCDVGTGAAPSLRCLTKDGKHADKQEALGALLKAVNNAKTVHAKSFWKTLKLQEARIRSHFKRYSLVVAQASTKERAMSAASLQVQLCEYRQFRHSIARLKYGLPDDENMRGEADTKTRLCAQNFVEFDEKRGVASFKYPGDDKAFDVPAKSVGGNQSVAVRVASMCFERLRTGAPRAEVEALRNDIVKGYRPGEDAPENNEAWEICRVQLSHPSPLVSFQVEGKDGKKFPFQTTIGAAGGVLEAERVARLCFVRIEKGATKEEALKYRNELYKASGAAPATKSKGAPKEGGAVVRAAKSRDAPKEGRGAVRAAKSKDAPKEGGGAVRAAKSKGAPKEGGGAARAAKSKGAPKEEGGAAPAAKSKGAAKGGRAAVPPAKTKGGSQGAPAAKRARTDKA